MCGIIGFNWNDKTLLNKCLNKIKHRGPDATSSYSYKNVSFQTGYFIFSVAVSGAVGLLAAWVTKDLGINFLGLPALTPAIAIIIGYAGGDFIENLFKIITGKTSLYELPGIIK